MVFFIFYLFFFTSVVNWRVLIEKRSLFWEQFSHWSLCHCVVLCPIVCAGFLSAQTGCHAQSAEMHLRLFNCEALTWGITVTPQTTLVWRFKTECFSSCQDNLEASSMNHPKMSSDALLFVNQFLGHSWTVYVQVKVLLLVGWFWNVNAPLLWLLTMVVNSCVSIKVF